MRERLKTGVLTALVISSVILTGLLLFGQPPLETAAPPAYERLVFGELRPVSQHVLPQLRLTTEDSLRVLQPWHENHALAWEIIIDLFSHSSTPQQAQLPDNLPEHGVSARFPVPAQPGLWLPAARPASLEIIEMAWFSGDPNTVWYAGSDGEWYSSRLAQLPENWEDILAEVFAGSNRYLATEADDWGSLTVGQTVFIPAEMPVMAVHAVSREDLDKEKLLRSIFVDSALVRQIQERDGAYIYTDGQRGLRIFEHGELEYTSPKSEPGLEPMETMQALRRTAQYLQLMGGWPEHLFLQAFSATSKLNWNSRQWNTYTVSFFSVQQGYPFVTVNPPVILRFSDRGVIDYKRQIVLLDGPSAKPRKLLDPRKAAAVAADRLIIGGGEAALVEVYPAFYLDGLRQPAAQPVWILHMENNKRAVIHGHTGSFLAWLE
ncbi:MAG: two-component system activity regulator YycH [Bacillota bacterium]|nr:two-component system activity regulator YycH [Bacillota bacterium]MDW7685233.1 two-component system activity regulator YycH [Bacillota bacterium]